MGADLEKAANDVRDKVAQAARNLPVDIDAPPVVTKADANSDPIITVSVQSTTMNALELSDYAENILQEKLQTIPGLSSVVLFGQKRPAMRLWLNPDKMAAYNVTPQDVNAVLAKENVELPSGKLTGKSTELIVKTFGLLVTEEDFNNLIIRQTNDQVVRFSDIGEAVLGPENPETGIKLNGADGIFLRSLPLPGANTIEIADEFYKRFDEIKKNLPPGLRLDIGYDKSKFVRASVSDVRMTIGIALFLVILIVFLFFRNWVLALRPLIDIPVSLISAFFIMYVFGFSINVLTLLAIVLATGLVVDDGIVVTENIYKKIERGMGIWDACIMGTREVFFVVIATSMTLAVVFIPVIFLQGFTGRLFREFGIVLAGAVLVSAFVSLTLTPVLNLKLGKINQQHSKFYQSTEPFFVGLEANYRRVLAGFMRRKWLAFVILGVCLVLIVVFVKTLKSELAPLEDHSLVRANITLPEGTGFDYTQNLVDRIAQLEMDSISEARLVFAGAGLGGGATNSGVVQTFLWEPNQRKATQQQIYDRLSKMYKRFPGRARGADPGADHIHLALRGPSIAGAIRGAEPRFQQAAGSLAQILGRGAKQSSVRHRRRGPEIQQTGNRPYHQPAQGYRSRRQCHRRFHDARLCPERPPLRVLFAQRETIHGDRPGGTVGARQAGGHHLTVCQEQYGQPYST